MATAQKLRSPLLEEDNSMLGMYVHKKIIKN
jgi:hypothetical protein